MIDIVERLNQFAETLRRHGFGGEGTVLAGADEVVRLRVQLKRERELADKLAAALRHVPLSSVVTYLSDQRTTAGLRALDAYDEARK